MNDADIEMAELSESANHEARLKRHGICTHGFIKALVCQDCGAMFDSEAHWWAERQEILI